MALFKNEIEFQEELKKACPSTPTHFKNVVNESVAQALNGDRKRNAAISLCIRRIAVTVAACVLLVGGTVAAASIPAVKSWLSGLGTNEESAEKLVQTEVEADEKQGKLTEVADEDFNKMVIPKEMNIEPSLEISDSYTDGTTIMVWAKAAEGTEDLIYDVGDHIYVNGVDCQKQYMVQSADMLGYYELKINILDEIPDNGNDALNIDAKLYVGENEKQTFSFSIPATGMDATRTVANQTIEVDGGSIEVTDISASPSAVKFKLWFKLTDADEEAGIMMNAAKCDGYYLESDKDIRLMDNECARTIGVFDEEKMVEIELDRFDFTSKTITLIPYTTQWNAEDGKRIPGTEVLDETRAFTISLQ